MTQHKDPIEILVITGTRAEYGLLYPVLCRLKADPRFDLRILATCMHLSHQHGYTIDEIRQDGFSVDVEVDLALAGDRDLDIAAGMGRGLVAMSAAMAEHRPDAVMVLGDRFEILAAACAASAMRIPVIHLEGGHVTEGAMDDAFRHAITKLSHLHFTACDVYRNRIIQLGEQENRVFSVGSTGLDNFLNDQRLSRKELAIDLGFSFAAPLFLVTFHPATLEQGLSDADQIAQLLQALEKFDQNQILITAPNADAGSRVIHDALKAFADQNNSRRKFITSLGRRRYASVLAVADCVIGNSSSGLIEAPSFAIPTVNIGARQDGRIRAASVIDCPVDAASITVAINKAVSKQFRALAKKVQNPFGDGHASERIIEVLAKIDLSGMTRKKFRDLP